ncbi:MAG: bifunctional folylpolyglutamate synthase/dihydrofolate synthase [Flavobacteriia bacterium]
MPHKDYSQAIDWLFKQFPSYQQIGSQAYKPDLVNVRELCKLFDDPQNDLNFVHVAGTNGKGSTSSMLASILTESGQTCGLFTSPHIIDFRERIRVNGNMIPEESVISFCNKVRHLKLKIEPSFFEITFVMALVHFKESKCNVAVIETGLGGRLDATNIIQPILSIITNISMEHTQFLGNTLDSIAREKAGIIKKYTPVIIGEAVPETKTVFERISAEHNAKIIFSEEHASDQSFKSPLIGDYQQKNLQTVLTAISELNKSRFNITPANITEGINNLSKNTGFFGRMQVISKAPLTILDVSHNEDGIRKTLDSLRSINKGKLHLIYGSSADKNYREIVNSFPEDASLNLCHFSNQRSLNKKELEVLSLELASHPKVHDNIKDAIRDVQSIANKTDTILVFGSFFLISDFF